MAYVNPRIRFRENYRHICRGTYKDEKSGRFILQGTEDETIKLILDYTDLLDGDTISVTAAADGATATPSESSGVVTLTISAINDLADIDLAITFSGGRIRQDFIRCLDPSSHLREDYGLVKANT